MIDGKELTAEREREIERVKEREIERDRERGWEGWREIEKEEIMGKVEYGISLD